MTTDPNFNAVPGNMILDATTGAFIPANTFVDNTGQLVAPPGYAFVDAYVNQPPTPQQQPVMGHPVFSPAMSPMFSPGPMSPGLGPQMPTGEGFLGPAYGQTRGRGRPRVRPRRHSSRKLSGNLGGHGIKQDLIDVVQTACKEYFTKQQTFVCIRNEAGGQTIRITLKKIESLRKIRSTVAKLNNTVEIEEFSMHVLLRNRKQHQTRRKSGLTMYVKLKNPEDAPKALEILKADNIPASLVTRSDEQVKEKDELATPIPILTEKKPSAESTKPKMPSLEKEEFAKAKAPVEDEDEDFEPPLPPRPPKKIPRNSDEDFTPPIPLLKKRSSSFSLKLENGEVLELEVETDRRTGAKLTANSSLELQDALYKYVPKAPLPGTSGANES